jgi:hypothetical protein
MSSARERALVLLREMIPDLPSDSGRLPQSDAERAVPGVGAHQHRGLEAADLRPGDDHPQAG